MSNSPESQPPVQLPRNIEEILQLLERKDNFLRERSLAREIAKEQTLELTLQKSDEFIRHQTLEEFDHYSLRYGLQTLAEIELNTTIQTIEWEGLSPFDEYLSQLVFDKLPRLLYPPDSMPIGRDLIEEASVNLQTATGLCRLQLGDEGDEKTYFALMECQDALQSAVYLINYDPHDTTQAWFGFRAEKDSFLPHVVNMRIVMPALQQLPQRALEWILISRSNPIQLKQEIAISSDAQTHEGLYMTDAALGRLFAPELCRWSTEPPTFSF